MKKYFVPLPILFIFFLQHKAQGQSATRVFTNNEWIEMIDNYDGMMRNHKKTDGIVVDPKRMTDILNAYPGKKLAILFARYPKGYEVNGKKGRVTMVLYIQNEQDKTQDQFVDLGGGAICPPPICDPQE